MPEGKMTTPSSNNLVQNGSFEQGANPGAYLPLQPGSTVIANWTVILGGIDYVGTDWAASNGNRSLDLNGTPGVGGIEQTFATTPGQTYQVSFDMAGHYSGLLQTMEVRASGQAKDFTFQSGTDRNHLGWQSDTWTFTANTPQTTLAFYSLQSGYPYGGPALDNVVVQATQHTAGGSNHPPGSGAPLSTVAQITPAMIGSSAASISFLPVIGHGHTISAHPDREMLVGSFQHNDTFQGTSTNLNGDLILFFGGKDVIDVTDLNFASTMLHYQGTAIRGTLDLNDGVHSTRISLAGEYHQANFHLASDMHGGTNVTYG